MYLHFICRVINLYCWQVKTIILCVCTLLLLLFSACPLYRLLFYFTYIFLFYTLPFFFCSMNEERTHTWDNSGKHNVCICALLLLLFTFLIYSCVYTFLCLKLFSVFNISKLEEETACILVIIFIYRNWKKGKQTEVKH